LEDEINEGEKTLSASEDSASSLPSLPREYKKFLKVIEEWKRFYPYIRIDKNPNRSHTNFAKCFLCGEWFRRRNNGNIYCSRDCQQQGSKIRESFKPKKPDKTEYEWVLDMSTWEWSRK